MDNTQVAVAYRTTDEMVADTNEIRTTLRSRHEAIVDLLISAPHLKIREIAERVGLSQSYISTLINSDTFRTRLAERREQLIDPLIVTSFEDRMRGAMAQSLEVLTDELEKSKPPTLPCESSKSEAEALRTAQDLLARLLAASRSTFRAQQQARRYGSRMQAGISPHPE